MKSRQRQDLVGRVCGLVTVESFAGLDEYSRSTWNVVCECGQRRVAPSQQLLHKPPTTHIACRRARMAEREKTIRAERERGP